MSHEELLVKIDGFTCCSGAHELALRAVVKLCNDWETRGSYCLPIEDVIQAIEAVISSGR